MKKYIVAFVVFALPGVANAADETLLTVKIAITAADSPKCVYRFFSRDNKIHYEADPVSLAHCPTSLDLSKSVTDVYVQIPIKDVPIEGEDVTCKLQVNKYGDKYVYSWVASNYGCDGAVDVTLDQP